MNTLQLNCIIQPADMIGEDCERLPIGDVAELQSEFNVNLNDEGEAWFDEEITVGYVDTIDEDEFFNRYFGE